MIKPLYSQNKWWNMLPVIWAQLCLVLYIPTSLSNIFSQCGPLLLMYICAYFESISPVPRFTNMCLFPNVSLFSNVLRFYKCIFVSQCAQLPQCATNFTNVHWYLNALNFPTCPKFTTNIYLYPICPTITLP